MAEIKPLSQKKNNRDSVPTCSLVFFPIIYFFSNQSFLGILSSVENSIIYVTGQNWIQIKIFWSRILNLLHLLAHIHEWLGLGYKENWESA